MMNRKKEDARSDWLRSLTFLAQALILLSVCASRIHAQRESPNRPSMRETVRNIQMKDMDQQLLLAPLLAKNEDSHRLIVLKQLREDFRDLQGLNNRMMSAAWARETLDYTFVSDMVSRIKGKATRLKSNLNLPESGKIEKNRLDQNIANANDFRAALLILDRTIMSFISNPLFQKPNTIEINQAMHAREDLESIIELTANLKRIALRLGKVYGNAK